MTPTGPLIFVLIMISIPLIWTGVALHKTMLNHRKALKARHWVREYDQGMKAILLAILLGLLIAAFLIIVRLIIV